MVLWTPPEAPVLRPEVLPLRGVPEVLKYGYDFAPYPFTPPVPPDGETDRTGSIFNFPNSGRQPAIPFRAGNRPVSGGDSPDGRQILR